MHGSPTPGPWPTLGLWPIQNWAMHTAQLMQVKLHMCVHQPAAHTSQTACACAGLLLAQPSSPLPHPPARLPSRKGWRPLTYYFQQAGNLGVTFPYSYGHKFGENCNRPNKLKMAITGKYVN